MATLLFGIFIFFALISYAVYHTGYHIPCATLVLITAISFIIWVDYVESIETAEFINSRYGTNYTPYEVSRYSEYIKHSLEGRPYAKP